MNQKLKIGFQWLVNHDKRAEGVSRDRKHSSASNKHNRTWAMNKCWVNWHLSFFFYDMKSIFSIFQIYLERTILHNNCVIYIRKIEKSWQTINFLESLVGHTNRPVLYHQGQGRLFMSLRARTQRRAN